MKKYINISACLFAMVAMTSCFADKPLDKYDSDFVFGSQIKAEGYALSVYNGLPFSGIGSDGYCRVDGAMLACATDEAALSKEGSSVLFLNNGSLTARKSNPDGCWSESYKFIRDANIGIANFHKMPESYSDLRKQLTGEMLFLNAYQYFELVKRYGGVPIMDDVAAPSNAGVPRSSFSACIEYICGLCDDAYDLLPQNNDVAFGRASKGAALALKSRALLYAASPLYNGKGYDGSGNEFISYGSADASRWNAAAEAAAAVIKENYYSIYAPKTIEPSDDDASVIAKGAENYRKLFLTISGNKELILSRTASMGNSVETMQFPYGMPNAKGIISPSQQMVDAYGMVNGKNISDAASDYDENNPYVGRDPRFYASVFYNGQVWNKNTIETYVGGLHNNAADATKTGYYLSKFCSEDVLISGNTNTTYHCFPLIRYAEILLNYAEAANEAFGPDKDQYGCGLTAREAVELVRSRVLRPADAAVTAADAAALREIIREERRVELAFEDHRYFDLKRWMLAEDVLNEDIEGMNILKVGSAFAYSRVSNVEARQFTTKFYIYPIPNSDVVNNPAIARNNPLW